MAFRKSFKVGGVRVTASRSGVGYSVGGKGTRVTKRADGRVTRTESIPGTGWSRTTSIGRTRRSKAGIGAAVLGALFAGFKASRKRRR